MAQPNIQELVGSLRTITREVERFENVPALGGLEAVNARLDRLFQQHHQIQDTINEVQGTLNEVRDTINQDRQEMFRRLNLLPMRMYNRSRGDNGVLDGRDGRIPDEFPNTLGALRAANRNECDALARHLNIRLRGNMRIQERRQEIAQFLGVHL
ncbi:hypothetical protein F5141DRAFT_1213583 [Pisolithus sp. B1]|nr:hypothetical protein F5141DRAFT_1213583 [Pisolithus sp. B1]